MFVTDPSLGTRYQLGPLIGEGGFGRVYAAKDSLLERDVAIKIAREGQFSRFSREARAAAALQSPHTVRVFDFGRLDTGAPYLIMERLTGRSLKQQLQDSGPIAAERAVEWVLQVCRALAEAHSLGLVHRDVKPSNLFLHHGKDSQPFIKLLDFGLVKSRADSKDITESGIALGSPAYMAPEQLRGGQVDARSDVWALGIVLFELITGKRPFDGPTNEAILSAVAADPPQFDAWTGPMPRGLLAVVEGCLRKDLSTRIQSVAALSDALTDVTTGHPVCANKESSETLKIEANVFSTSHPRTQTAPGPKFNWGALTLALGVGAFATVIATQASRPRPEQTASLKVVRPPSQPYAGVPSPNETPSKQTPGRLPLQHLSAELPPPAAPTNGAAAPPLVKRASRGLVSALARPMQRQNDPTPSTTALPPADATGSLSSTAEGGAHRDPPSRVFAEPDF